MQRQPGATTPATTPTAAVDGTAIRTARRPLRKSRTSQPCSLARRSSVPSGFTATGRPTAPNKGRSFEESL